MIGRADERADARFGDAEFLEEFLGLLRGQINQVALNLRADDHGFAGEMRLHIVADLEDIGVLVGGGEIGLLDVAGKDGRLVREQEKWFSNDALLRRQLTGERGLAGIQHRFEFFQDRLVGQCHLVTPLGILGDLLQPLLDGIEIA